MKQEPQKQKFHCNTNLTPKQRQQLQVICDGNRDGSPVDIYQLLDRLPYKTSRQSYKFSLNSLIKKGMVVKTMGERRGCAVVTIIEPTPLAKHLIGFRKRAFIEDVSAREILDEIRGLLD